MAINNLLFIDTETTGLDPTKHSILQISARLVTPDTGTVINSFNIYMFPDNKTSTDITAIACNKLTINPTYLNNAVDNKVGLGEFFKYLLSLPKNVTVVGQNVEFDLKFIDESFKRNDITGFRNLLGRDLEDTKTVASFLKSCEILKLDGTSLHKLAKALGIVVKEEELHNANVDVDLTIVVYFKLKELVRGLRNVEVKEVQK